MSIAMVVSNPAHTEANAYRTPDIVKELVAAADDLRSLAAAMNSCKQISRKVSQVVQVIAIGVTASAKAAHCSDEAHAISPAVLAALTATRDAFIECFAVLRSTAARSTVARVITKAKTLESMNAYLSALEALRDLLKMDGGLCGLMQDPVGGLGIDASQCSKSVVLYNISAVDAVYDGLKVTLNVMANITDGLPWPMKAVPQTLLFILKLFEDCNATPTKIAQLLSEIQGVWKAVADFYERSDISEPLGTHVNQFFETLQRIAIRLGVVLALGKVKAFFASYTVSAVIDDETRRLADARRHLGLSLRTATITQMGQLTKRVNQVLSSVPLASNIKTSATIPPAPHVFHGRKGFVDATVETLIRPTASHIAIVGTGGIGKTSIALTVIHDYRVKSTFQSRLFLSCEALVDADSLIVALGTLLGLEASNDLLTDVISAIQKGSRLLLMLDNLETIWLVENTVRASEVERLLQTFAAIDSLSLVITCRGVVLPPGIEWSNPREAVVEPFSLHAARHTFLDISRVKLDEDEENALDELLRAVDGMPLAVSILGQLADAEWGSTPSELLQRWNLQHSALLQTRKSGREYNVDASIALSIDLLRSATDSPEPLQLLSICCMLQDGLRPAVANQLRPHFQDIHGARQLLRKFALISLDVEGVVRLLSPIRQFIRTRFPVEDKHHETVCSIYFGIADRLPTRMDERFKELAAAVAPEMANLSSLLFVLTERPTDDVVHSVVRLTQFLYWRQPTVTLAAALLPHLDENPSWKAPCLRAIGRSQQALCDYRGAMHSFKTAAALFLELDDPTRMAGCKSSVADLHRVLHEYDDAETILNEVRNIYAKIGAEIDEARCITILAKLMRSKGDHEAALQHLTAATAIFDRHLDSFGAAQCLETLGLVYLDQQSFEFASRAFEAALSVFANIGNQHHQAQNTRFLGTVRRLQGNFQEAEQLFAEAEVLNNEVNNTLGLAECALEFGYLRRAEERSGDAMLNFARARDLYEVMGLSAEVKLCHDEIGLCS